jgi:hypothetical protein
MQQTPLQVTDFNFVCLPPVMYYGVLATSLLELTRYYFVFDSNGPGTVSIFCTVIVSKYSVTVLLICVSLFFVHLVYLVSLTCGPVSL